MFYYFKYKVKTIDKEEKIITSVFDENLKIIKKIDSIQNLFMSKTQQSLDNIFLKSNDFIVYKQ